MPALPTDTSTIQTGNTAIDATKGWFVGGFLDETYGIRASKAVELKWGTHTAGEERSEWSTNEVRTTIGILISGKWEMIFRDQTVTLSKPGDFVMWGKGTDHKWRALEDTILLTVRWPSIKQ